MSFLNGMSQCLDQLHVPFFAILESHCNQMTDYLTKNNTFSALIPNKTLQKTLSTLCKTVLKEGKSLKAPISIGTSTYQVHLDIVNVDQTRYVIGLLQSIKKNDLYTPEMMMYKLLDALPASVYWKNKEGRYLGCNQYMLNMAGLSDRKDMIGKTDSELPWREFSNTLKEIDQRIIVSGQENEFEETPTLANGEYRVYLTSKTPLYDESGEIVGIIGNSMDITERKQLQEKLVTAKIKAEAANKAKSEFITNMSHDLRTPLTGGIGLAEGIIKYGKTPANRQRGQLLLHTFKRYLMLFNEVLEVLSLEAGNVSASVEPFSLRGLIDHNLGLQAAALKAKGLSIELCCDDELAPIYEGYAHYLSRVVLNLISNAVKFTKEGGIKIDVNVIEESIDEHTVEIKVIDTGVGIPSDKFEEIFYHFSRLHPSYEAQYEGYGLGLYSVQQYVKLMHGTVCVKSTQGQGSTFFVTVVLKPIVDETIDKASIRYNDVTPFDKSILEAVEENPPDNEEGLENSEPEDTKPSDATYSVLIVEDNPLAATMAAIQFEHADCATDTAATGEEALKQVQAKHYDLIMMDIGLGNESGIDVTKQIKALGEHYAKIPVVALTAHLNDNQKHTYLDAGMVDVLSKPITPEQAKELLKKYLGQKS